jgi:hypothetical protein
LSSQISIVSNGARTVTWVAPDDVLLHRAILQVQLCTLTTDEGNKATNPSDQVNENLLIWNLGTEPLSAEVSYPIRKGQKLYFTSPAGGGACNLIYDLTSFGQNE